MGFSVTKLCVFLCCVLSISLLFAYSSPSNSGRDNKRTIAIYNIHTKEKIKVLYKRDGRYIESALKKINHVMRDWRRNQSTKIDPKLIDLMWEIHNELGSKRHIHLISGYRSPKTNNMLRKTRGGQARRSRHILGKAADVHFPDVSVRKLRNSALVRQRGGVGYYPTSAIPFIHLDTGRVRHWPRLGRYELAALFPSGRTKHVPKDGKPIRKIDYRVAIAKLKKRRDAAVLLASLPKKRKRRAKTRVASLTPSFVPSLSKKIKKKPKKKPSFDKEALLKLAYGNARGTPDVSANEPKNGVNWVTAPAYDEEHPDELSYTPFPVLPLMKEKSVSYDTQLASLRAPEHDKAIYLFGEPRRMIPLRFRQGLQFAEMLWASEFNGKAVINLMTGDIQKSRQARAF